VCLRDKYVTEVTPAHEAAEREGIIKRYPLGHTECLVADARSFVDWAVEKHKTHPELWRRKL
jgi:aminoglycoside N3'-acetyltransferase